MCVLEYAEISGLKPWTMDHGFDEISFRTHNSSLEGATKLKFVAICCYHVVVLHLLQHKLGVITAGAVFTECSVGCGEDLHGHWPPESSRPSQLDTHCDTPTILSHCVRLFLQTQGNNCMKHRTCIHMHNGQS